MKKFIALLLIFTLVFAGCSGKEEKTFPTDEAVSYTHLDLNKNTSPSQAPTPPKNG